MHYAHLLCDITYHYKSKVHPKKVVEQSKKIGTL